MSLQFTNAWMLYGLWLAPVLGLIWLMLFHRRARALEHFLSPAMRQKLCPPPQPQRFYWQWSCLLAGSLLALIAAARPQWGMREETVIQRGRDLMIVLDVSRSMQAQDVHPSRLQRAKTDIQDLLRELRGDRAALVTFRGRAIQLCPLTTDYAYLEQILNDATVESAPRGETDIGDAIRKALAAFESDQGSHQAIVLISDGEDLSGKARAAAEEAKKKGVVIFTVGLGDPKGARIPSPVKKDEVMMYQGKEVVTRLEHDTLKAIAEITGGAYVPVGVSNVKLGALYRDHLSKIAAQDIEESIQRRYIDRFQWFLCPAIILLLVTALLSRGRLVKQSAAPVKAAEHAAGPAAASLLILLLAGNQVAFAAPADTNGPPPITQTISNVPDSSVSNSTAATTTQPARTLPSGKEGARVAQRLYLQGKYREAAEAYLQASRDVILKLQNDFTYNAACALYRAGQYQAAADKFAEVASREEYQAAAAQYNAGCSWFRLSEQTVSGTESNRNYALRPILLERSGQAFQRALRLNPGQSSARDNLATAVQALPEAREQAKTRALMDKYGKAPPFQITDEMLTGQRKIIEDMPPAMTNATPTRIDMMETLADRQRQNSDLLIPLRASLATAMAAAPALSSNAPANPQQQMAEALRHLDAVQNVMQESRGSLRNLENNAYGSAATAEAGIYTFWKAVAPFPQLLREDMRRQTNAIDGARSATGMSAQVNEMAQQDILAQQEEAIQLTQLFTDRFSQSVPPEGLKPQPASGQGMSPPGTPSQDVPPPAAGGTNAPKDEGITAEKRANILNLAHEAKACQEQASKLLSESNLKDSLNEQQNAYNLLLAIDKLLPKNKQNQQQQQNQQQNQQQKEQEEQKDQQKQDQQQKQEKNQEDQRPQEQPQPPPEQQPPQEQQPQPAAADQPKPKDKEMTPEQAQALLEKARQREKDHQEERMRDRYIPPSPVEKDW
ncbi:MAG: VWA domain-containing protein [Verrucomicrobia bacterium]|nr:VWA domain-containing protein [Verrucomicrobiota bacterium]MCG2681676.1 VWA domain-containing protein [Kiritimatiellia bacterium]MBU4247416.1 VWA domain-containing protein [Verrucomicrobiota bacterium]MBU4290954.1 VWA domain-containing protein [Verrucomicrobiota bacterium]MBU4428892.1 VWA domain-containing protein [Verrucomicrobiota bacterium]